MSGPFRVLRVLEYVGEREAVEKVLSQNAVKGYRDFGTVIVREAVLGAGFLHDIKEQES